MRVPVEAAPAPSSRPAHALKSHGPRFKRTPPISESLRRRPRLDSKKNHRQLLSYTLSGDRGSCRERIGRLCIWHEGDDDWVPVPDSPDIVQARDLLLRELAEIGGQLPGDGWILGQRIRYLSEAGRWDESSRPHPKLHNPRPRVVLRSGGLRPSRHGTVRGCARGFP